MVAGRKRGFVFVALQLYLVAVYEQLGGSRDQSAGQGALGQRDCKRLSVNPTRTGIPSVPLDIDEVASSRHVHFPAIGTVIGRGFDYRL